MKAADLTFYVLAFTNHFSRLSHPTNKDSLLTEPYSISDMMTILTGLNS